MILLLSINQETSNAKQFSLPYAPSGKVEKEKRYSNFISVSVNQLEKIF